MNGEVGTWTNNYLPRETMDAITMPDLGLSLTILLTWINFNPRMDK